LAIFSLNTRLYICRYYLGEYLLTASVSTFILFWIGIAGQIKVETKNRKDLMRKDIHAGIGFKDFQ